MKILVKGHDRRYVLDDSALRALGYEPRIAFRAGLAETVRWYRDNRDWWAPLKPVAPVRDRKVTSGEVTGSRGSRGSMQIEPIS